MKIALGSDHRGFPHKELLLETLGGRGVTAEDFGCRSDDPSDYPDAAFLVAEQVARGLADAGVLICGSGIGMSIAANKVSGVRAALCACETTARLSRQHNDANILCVGARITGLTVLEEMVRIFLETPFEGGRHQRRVDKMNDLD